MAKEEKRLRIRKARPADAAALCSIYRPYVERTAVTFEYRAPTAEEFEGRIRRTLERYPYLAAEQDGVLLGYAYAGPFHDRPAYDWAVETSLYVQWDHRGQGLGRKLHQALEEALRAQGILNMNACIAYCDPEDQYLSQASVRFHEALGYRLVGEFKACGYKFDRWYNMVWMEKHIGLHGAHQPQPLPFSEVEGPWR